MKVILFGATGMVGQGVLRACLQDRDVTEIVIVARQPIGCPSPKVTEIICPDIFAFKSSDLLSTYDACFFCLGVSSFRMKETEYARLTFDLTLSVAHALCAKGPMIFIYVSGAGTDTSEKGTAMWARVKGRTENALLALPPLTAYMMRPGIIEPLHGIRSKTRLYRSIYTAAKPLFWIFRLLAPDQFLTTEDVGRAMIATVRIQPSHHVLETRDIASLAHGKYPGGPHGL